VTTFVAFGDRAGDRNDEPIMNANAAIARERLINQRVIGPACRGASDVISWCGAVQAQEFEPATWGVGLRMRAGTRAADVEEALERGAILRTHVMRPTWHFVAADDIAWLQTLTGPRVQRAMLPYHRQLELDANTLVRAAGIVERALRDRTYLTRHELGERLQRKGLAMSGQRLAHVAMYAELEGIICSGPRRGKQSTYALIAERAPQSRARAFTRDEALRELARRFFRSHGPATIRDFVWWSGLRTADATRGLEMNDARRELVDGRAYFSAGRAGSASPSREHLAHLLPIYDEFIVSYRDRAAVPHAAAAMPRGAGTSVTFQHALIIGGQIAGTWRLTKRARGVSLRVFPTRPLKAREQEAVAGAIDRYARFRRESGGLTVLPSQAIYDELEP
jgi:hypothetical protein